MLLLLLERLEGDGVNVVMQDRTGWGEMGMSSLGKDRSRVELGLVSAGARNAH